MNDRLSTLYKIEKDLLTELDSIQKTIESFGGTPTTVDKQVRLLPEKNYAVVIPDVIHTKYPKEGTWEEKIKYSLRELKGRGTSPEIVNVIKKHDQTLKYEKIYKAVQMYTSSLYKHNKLKADKTGNRNVWYL